ncbi:MAG: hypothetical protein JNM56_40260 [Planctomycetia bacterium]|nr:hypothetical protein [Planctomycetia bacterium]
MTTETLAPDVAAAPDELLWRGNFYAEGLYAQTNAPQGVMRNRLGTRLCALTDDFLLGMNRAITDECGPAATAVFKRCGRRWGELLARRFEQEMTQFYGQPLHDFSMATFLACLVELFSHHGWGRLHLDLEHYEQGLLIAELHGAIMADLLQQTEQPADALFAGIFAGFFAQLTGEPLECVQTACTACGAASSQFIIGLASRLTAVEGWQAAGKSHAEIVAALAEVRAA